jgi:hypothetical protein
MRALRSVCTVGLLLAISVASCLAQEVTGTISGTIKDEQGGILPGVSVSARNVETGSGRTVITDDVGVYRLAQLAPGRYEIKAELAGFQTAVLQNIAISLAQEAVVGITMKVGEISEQVVVSAEVSLVETRSATVASLVDTQQVRDLPLNGRDFLQLAALQEGVVAPASERVRTTMPSCWTGRTSRTSTARHPVRSRAACSAWTRSASSVSSPAPTAPNMAA